MAHNLKKHDKKFDFKKWADSFIYYSGVNILEPVIKFEKDGSLKEIEVKQSLEKAGNNRLR